MRVFITGATGFIGRALILNLVGRGHQVKAWVRDEPRARALLGPSIDFAVAPRANLNEEIAAADAVINLAGEPIFKGRWNAARKRALISSRLDTTRAIVDAIGTARTRPRVLISASAVGYFGDRGDDFVDDNASSGSDFLADLCRQWEAEAMRARQHGVRVFIPRIGIVLGGDGGALAAMVTPARFGAGGPLGSGRQYIPWIHIDDIVEVLVRALEDVRFDGPMIATAPAPVTSSEMARAIGRAIHRPSFVPAPALALRLLLGEAAGALLTGQRVQPLRLKEIGFEWRFAGIESALADILSSSRPAISRIDSESPKPAAGRESNYLASRPPRFVLESTTLVAAPLEQVFDFFSKPENLGVMTPASMQFRITSLIPSVISQGLQIEYTIKLGPVPVKWRTTIEVWDPPEGFADSQDSGPYRSWWHEHRFAAIGHATEMEDRVFYAVPGGILGDIVNALVVAPALRRIFSFRAHAMRLRFPVR